MFNDPFYIAVKRGHVGLIHQIAHPYIYTRRNIILDLRIWSAQRQLFADYYPATIDYRSYYWPPVISIQVRKR